MLAGHPQILVSFLLLFFFESLQLFMWFSHVFYFFIKGQLIYSVMLISSVQTQRPNHTYTHFFPPSIFHHVLSQRHWIWFPVLHRRTSLLIHSKCSSLHSPLPNSRYWFLNIIVLSIPTTYMRRLCSFVEEPLLWSILVPKRYFPAMANSVIARVQDHSCTNFLQHKRQTRPSQICVWSFDHLRSLRNLLLTGTSL